ncbi:MAG: MFS transporter [Xanthobacteraceae bacterium]
MKLFTPADDSVLRHPPFVLYWAARTCAAMAFQMLGVAVAWQMYALTGSALDLGLIGLMQFLPSAAFMLIAGQVADRYQRRRLLQLCQALECLALAALAAGAFWGFADKGFLLAAVLVFGVGRAFEAPTQQSLLAGVVPPSLFPTALAAATSTSQFATIIGPALGGVLYVLGTTIPYATCLALVLASIAMLGLVKVHKSMHQRTPVSLTAFFAGITYIRHNRVLLGVISLDLFAVLLGGATALLPIFADEILHAGPEGLGLLRAAPAAGALVVMSVLTLRPLRRGIGRIMLISVACFGVATIVFALSTSFILSMAALTVLGASDAVSVIIRVTLVQLETPDEMRGRVNAVNSLSAGTSNQLGEFRAGVMAAWLGTLPAVLVGGFGIIAVVLIWLRTFPALTRVESFSDQASSPRPLVYPKKT